MKGGFWLADNWSLDRSTASVSGGGAGWENAWSRILFGRGKSPKIPQNPTLQVHALLGNA